MFTGIIETLGIVTNIERKQQNVDFTIHSSLAKELKVDQSVSHNGVCLTVVERSDTSYKVTAILETLTKTNLNDLKIDDLINLERAMKIDARLDGHIVQGHVDQVGICTHVENENGSWRYTFSYDTQEGNVTIEKGSITINGVSLTVVDSGIGNFSVAIIPYTYEHTGFKSLKVDTRVNLEFDVIGKYVKRLTGAYL